MSIALALSRSLRAVNSHCPSKAVAFVAPLRNIRPISSSPPTLYSENKGSSNGNPQEDVSKDSTSHEGSFSRTDNQVAIPHPGEQNMPRSALDAGRSGTHVKPTLASFSLEGRVAVVTGGARGLGLVMAQALLISGADVAIVDLSSKQD